MDLGVDLFDENKISSLSELRERYKNCTKCELCNTRTQVVMWDGASQSDLMIVGQSPGANEDQSGVPFSGAAGKRLDAVLNLVGIKRSSIHISNAVWCRYTDGYKNLTPLPKHINTCNERLHQEIKLVNPKIIVCLGREAMNAVLGISLSAPVGKERAKGWRKVVLDGKMRWVLVSWHPAYELRATRQGNLTVNHQMASDWREISQKLEELANA